MKGSWHWYLKTVPACQVRFSISDGSWWGKRGVFPPGDAPGSNRNSFFKLFFWRIFCPTYFFGGKCWSVVDLEEIVGVKMLERSKVLPWVWKSPLLAWLGYIPEWIVIGLRRETSKQLHYLARYSKQKIGRIDKWATKKNRPTFHYIGWLIGILIMVYYNPCISG